MKSKLNYRKAIQSSAPLVREFIASQSPRIPVLLCRSFYDSTMVQTYLEVIGVRDNQPLLKIEGLYPVGIWPGVRIGARWCLTQMDGLIESLAKAGYPIENVTLNP